MTEIYSRLCQIVGKDRAWRDEPMSNHTTFRIGGCADYYVEAGSAQDVVDIILACREYHIDYYVLGNGSNLLVGDKGYRGVIIAICKNMDSVSVEGNVIRAMAGTSLARVANAAKDAALSGLEFAAGIPGTVGGAVVMNAGAYGGEISQVICEVTAVTDDGQIVLLKKDDLHLGYRTSIFKQRSLVCTDVMFLLEPGDKDVIAAKMEELKRQRREKQPLEYPSAGSTFKRPEGYFAGKLIMDAGFAGFQIGGARVSEKHCGFVINAGGATASDVISLMEEVSRRVEADNGVKLEPEVCLLGEF